MAFRVCVLALVVCSLPLPGGAQVIADRLLKANANRTTGSPTRARI
jgi:hypothetical protein